MKIKMKRSLSFLVLLIMLVSVAGCQPGEVVSPTSTPGTTPTDSTDKNTDPPVEKETLKFSVTTADYGTLPTGKRIQEEWLAKMEELMGYKLDIDFNYAPWTDYATKVSVMVGSGSMSDIIFTGTALEPAAVRENAEKGVFEELTQYKDIMPNYYPLIEKYNNGSWINEKGHLYSFYGYQDTPDGSRRINLPSFIRKDILDQHSLSLPGTLDELYDVAIKLKELYPDTYPIGTQRSMLDTFLRINRVGGGLYLKDDMSAFDYGPLTDNYKDALQYMNKLYEAELIAPDYVSWTDEQKQAGVVNSQTFVYTTCWEYMFSNNNYNLDDSQEWVALVDLKNPKYGEPILWLTGQEEEQVYAFTDWYHTEINAQTKVDKELLVKFMDLQYHKDIFELIVWGIEGVTFEYNDEGDRVWMEDLQGERRNEIALDLGIYVFSDCRPGISPHPSSTAASYLSYPEDNIFYKGELLKKNLYLFARDEWSPAGANPGTLLNKNLNLTAEENEEYANIMTAVQTYVDENMSRFINGSKSFDEWDQFVEDMHQMGDINRALEIYNNYLD